MAVDSSGKFMDAGSVSYFLTDSICVSASSFGVATALVNYRIGSEQPISVHRGSGDSSAELSDQSSSLGAASDPQHADSSSMPDSVFTISPRPLVTIDNIHGSYSASRVGSFLEF